MVSVVLRSSYRMLDMKPSGKEVAQNYSDVELNGTSFRSDPPCTQYSVPVKHQNLTHSLLLTLASRPLVEVL